MAIYFSANNHEYRIDDYWTIETEYANRAREGKVYVAVYKDRWYMGLKHLSVYFRPERTWDDHMGNTPSGYYVRLPLGNGQTKRVYLYQ